MTDCTTTTMRPQLTVIEGGLRGTEGLSAMVRRVGDLPPMPQMGAAELAANMAELYALALLRDVPFDGLTDPYRRVEPGARESFTLHEVLCELRSLSWFDRRALIDAPSSTEAFSSRVDMGEPDHRRSLRWNGDGQLTLASLLRGPVAGTERDAAMSAFLRLGVPVGAVGDGGRAAPTESAPMSRWLDWLEEACGARLALPGDRYFARIATPADLARYIHEAPACQPFFQAALVLLAQGHDFDRGLAGTVSDPAGPWSAQRLLALMDDASRWAEKVALARLAQQDRASRPGVLAARLTALAMSDEPEDEGIPTGFGAVLDEVAGARPGLATWMTQLNAEEGLARDGRDCLILPPLTAVGVPLHPSDCASHAVVAGALATLVKAVFDTGGAQGPRAVDGGRAAFDAGAEIDRLASNVAMARLVAGGHFAIENHVDLRLGQALALHVLRERLEDANQDARLDFVDFDGVRVTLTAHRRAHGRGHASLRVAGDFATWPLDGGRTAHLTAVV